jgi:hypothetical protein
LPLLEPNAVSCPGCASSLISYIRHVKDVLPSSLKILWT